MKREGCRSKCGELPILPLQASSHSRLEYRIEYATLSRHTPHPRLYNCRFNPLLRFSSVVPWTRLDRLRPASFPNLVNTAFSRRISEVRQSDLGSSFSLPCPRETAISCLFGHTEELVSLHNMTESNGYYAPNMRAVPAGEFVKPLRRTNGAGVQAEDTRICVVMVGLPARGKSLIAQKGKKYANNATCSYC